MAKHRQIVRARLIGLSDICANCDIELGCGLAVSRKQYERKVNVPADTAPQQTYLMQENTVCDLMHSAQWACLVFL